MTDVENPYVACVSCLCYIARAESSCPFCATQQPVKPVQGPPARPASLSRLSRSQWLSVGAALTAQTALTALACSGHETLPRIPCGEATCDRATEVCVTFSYVELDNGGPDGAVSSQQCAQAQDTCDGGGWSEGLSVCDCLTFQIFDQCGGGLGECSLDGGEAQVTCEPAPCYGSPPVRRGTRVS